MKVIKYRFLSADLGEEKVFITKTMPYSEEILAIAENEAYEGVYTIEEVEEPPHEPTVEEQIEQLREYDTELLYQVCLLQLGITEEEMM